jgi:hypothetical protein
MDGPPLIAGFEGLLQVDGYGAYEALARGGDVTLAFCWGCDSNVSGAAVPHRSAVDGGGWAVDV